MTEEEAKTKWCPMARDVTGQDNGVQMAMASFNRPFNDSCSAIESCHCIVSECMMWRWHIDAVGIDCPDVISQTEGYCGLINGNNT